MDRTTWTSTPWSTQHLDDGLAAGGAGVVGVEHLVGRRSSSQGHGHERCDADRHGQGPHRPAAGSGSLG